MSPQTLMALEAAQAPAAVARQLEENAGICRELAHCFGGRPLRLVATCARGSSDHAAAYIKYLVELRLGIPVASYAPSVGSVYNRPVRMEDTLFWVISQSGQSPDLVASIRWARRNGAFTLALVNDVASPAARAAHLVLPLHAGPERAVAATKSYIASLAAALQVAAHFSQEEDLLNALQRLPGDLEAGLAPGWDRAVGPLAQAGNLFTVGRGLSLGIALEAALKLKETSALHAEAFSGAELMHGPLELVKEGFPVLMFSQNDQTAPGQRELAGILRELGALVFLAGEGPAKEYNLPVMAGLHPAAAPLAMIQAFYFLAEKVALARGLDPDRPRLLRKVTRTV